MTDDDLREIEARRMQSVMSPDPTLRANLWEQLMSNDLPRLLAEVRRLREENQMMEDRICGKSTKLPDRIKIR